MEPDNSAIDLPPQEDPDVLSTDWMGLRWSAWMPLMAAHPLALAQLPSEPGVYRVRCADASRRLEWIGWAGQGVREAVERLSRQVHMPVAPYDTPQSPALLLWTMKRECAAHFEVSGAASADPETEQDLRRAHAAARRTFSHAPFRKSD